VSRALVRALLLAATCSPAGGQGGDPDLYDIVWTSPGRDSSGSMPIGTAKSALA